MTGVKAAFDSALQLTSAPIAALDTRVKAELARWAIDIDDSAGEPLIRFAGAALLNLVLEAALTDFPAGALNALFSHPLCRFGMEPDAARRASRAIEIALFRNGYNGRGIADFAAAVQRCRSLSTADNHAHPLVQFLYWHMNFHIEHHMYAAVPCYNLAKLHRAIQHDLPPTPVGIVATWQEIIAILRKQSR